MGIYCEWDSTKGVNCQSDDKGYIRRVDGLPVGGGEVNYNDNGFYELVVTEPTIGADQVRDAEVWAKPDNTITKTWTVRDLTATELDQRIANPMSITDYYLWKALLVTGTITQQQAVNGLPAEMIDAYQARKRLLGD